MILSKWFGDTGADAARALYDRIVEQARDPAFYGAERVPDTLDGRFEMIALHAFLVLRRLQIETGAGALGQRLFDTMFTDMEFALREIGVGDLVVGKRVKDMAKGFYGRVAAYETGLADGSLEEPLARNLFGTVPGADGRRTGPMATYLAAAAAALAEQPGAEVLAGRIAFPRPPEF